MAELEMGVDSPDEELEHFGAFEQIKSHNRAAYQMSSATATSDSDDGDQSGLDDFNDTPDEFILLSNSVEGRSPVAVAQPSSREPSALRKEISELDKKLEMDRVPSAPPQRCPHDTTLDAVKDDLRKCLEERAQEKEMLDWCKTEILVLKEKIRRLEEDRDGRDSRTGDSGTSNDAIKRHRRTARESRASEARSDDRFSLNDAVVIGFLVGLIYLGSKLNSML
ncbi:hypothetical protein E3P99_02152 [Wallemia hederae]|uniref:Uncharacterized protein n=1 Tax=Wallemia hederae TaxID=1540922 RepID=A0A4T0FM93_9BASI|nr:hypothetical protein E3P99_02152 [Wallemia hederae]